MAHEAADLCEYLASHGYVVLASHSLCTRTSLLNFDPEGLATQARDSQFLLAYAHTLPRADVAHVAAAGWSWGGLPGLTHYDPGQLRRHLVPGRNQSDSLGEADELIHDSTSARAHYQRTLELNP